MRVTGAALTRGRAVPLPAMARRVPWTPSLVVLIAIIALGIFAPLLVGDPEVGDPDAQLAAPSLAHPFGTDQFGFDILARVIYSIRLDMGVALAAATLAVVIGMPLGAHAGFRRGWSDKVMLRFAEGFQSFPTLLLAIGISAALGASVTNLILVIGLINAPVFFRLTRNAVLPLREADFVVMARVAGRGTPAILWHHILPNVRAVIIAQFSVTCGWAMLTLAGLSFIGLGPPLPTPEWGSMIRVGSEFMVTGQWWMSVFPGLAILISVLALNQFADSLGASGRRVPGEE